MNFHKFILCILAATVSCYSETPQFPSVSSTWPGVTFEIVEMRRFPGDHLALVIQAKLEAKAQAPFVLGEPPAAGTTKIPEDAKEEDINIGDYQNRPYSLVPTKITDELTGKTYQGLSSPPAEVPFFALDQLVATLAPGKAVRLATCFKIPPSTDDKGQQKITIQFPRASQPMTGVVVPPLSP